LTIVFGSELKLGRKKNSINGMKEKVLKEKNRNIGRSKKKCLKVSSPV